MIDCSLYEASTKLSLEHMSTLAIRDSISNHYHITNYLKPAVYYNIPASISKPEHIDQEFGLLTGFQVHKKSCIYKRPEYNQGQWTNQFTRILPVESENKFNIMSKIRSVQRGD